MNALETAQRVHKSLSDRTTIRSAYRQLLRGLLPPHNSLTLFSTAEHMAPFNHRETVSFLIPQICLQSLGLVDTVDIIILSTTLIPADNRDYPRGVFLPGRSFPPSRINFIGETRRRCPVMLLPPTREVSSIPVDSYDKCDVIRTVLEAPVESYSAQIETLMQSMINAWRTSSRCGRITVVASEPIVTRILIELFESQDPFASSLFFDPAIRLALYKSLHGHPYAWREHRGTFLFWGVDHARGRLIPLREDSRSLVGHRLRIPLDRESLTRALQRQLILPSVLTSLFVVSWLPGIPVNGGSRQFLGWAPMVRILDQMLGTTTPLPLSVFGYGRPSWDTVCSDDRVAPLIPPFGSGLRLLETGIPVARIVDALQAVSDDRPVSA